MKNSELTSKARESLFGNWGIAILTLFVFSIFISITARTFLGILILGGPLTLGMILFSLSISRGERPRFEQLFDGFKNFPTSCIAYILVFIYTLLWSILLIVPGIIAAISYAQTFYIIADDSSITASEAIDKSQKMMRGNKAKYFWLCLRFTGWIILSIMTLGIGFLVLAPYMRISFTEFYEDIKKSTNEQ